MNIKKLLFISELIPEHSIPYKHWGTIFFYEHESKWMREAQVGLAIHLTDAQEIHMGVERLGE